MVLRIFFSSLFAIILFSCSDENGNNLIPSTEEKEDSGKVFFKERCAQCHGYDGAASLAGAADLTSSIMKDDSIRVVIENGKNAMPPFKSFVGSEDDLKAIIEYVKTLRK
jgi:mono/diheme cytochrome c family protein